MDVDHRVPVVLGHLEQQVVAGDAGVVDQDVEPTELARRRRRRPPRPRRRRRRRRPRPTWPASAPEAGGGLRGGVLVEVEDGDGGTLLREALGGGGTDAARAPGDDGDPTGRKRLIRLLLLGGSGSRGTCGAHSRPGVRTPARGRCGVIGPRKLGLPMRTGGFRFAVVLSLGPRGGRVRGRVDLPPAPARPRRRGRADVRPAPGHPAAGLPHRRGAPRRVARPRRWPGCRGRWSP